MAELQRQLQIAKFYRKLKILVVDDFENFRLSIKQMIRSFGVERIEVASNGEDAVARCEKDDFDVIICDYNLGSGKSGQQVLEELRFNKVLKHTSLFVMVTAETSKGMVLGALEYLPDGYITKPITKAVLQKRLDNLVEQREALKPINRAVDRGDIDLAVELLDKEIKSNTKYVTWCLRTLANLLYQKEEFELAKKIYESVLSKRDIGWARLGMGKVRIALGENEEAVADLEGLLQNNENLIEAYDALADAYLNLGQSKRAQQTLEQAVALSPHAIMRQKKLAKVSNDNRDYESASEAHRKTMKLGFNSVHESAENYLNLGRCLSDLAEGDSTEIGRKRAKEAVHTMERVAKKYNDDSNVKMSAALIECRVHQGQGNDLKSKEAMAKAEKVMDVAEADVQTALEFAKTLYQLDRPGEAEVLLCELASKYASDSRVIAQIEALLDEPVSLKLKEKARSLNKAGIGAFEKGDLPEAIKVFEEALVVTPKHPALNLNMVQVMLKQIDLQGGNPELKRKCAVCLENVKHIPEQHRQYKRLQFLLKKVGAL
jgi:CheY-like chemotaxis protein/cytochrome c-type biogenesis protein CcmH/NrfG